MQRIRTYRSIQALRAFAALGVVAFHTNGNIAQYGWLPELFARVSRYGEIGVDVFFVISGFVMALVTHDEPPGMASAKSFFAARLARVVPLYWLLSALYVVFLFGLPDVFGHVPVIGWNVLTSLLFFPSVNGTHITAPVLGVGWTLNYEMWFYVVFAIALCVTRYRLLAIGAFLLLTSALRLLHAPGVAADFYTNPLVLEFVFGCCVGAFYASGRKVPVLGAAALLVVTALAGKAFAPTLTDANRVLVFGLPALAVVVTGLSLENRLRWSALVERIGDSSYSLYLSHVFSVPLAAKLLSAVDPGHRIPADLACVLVVLIAVAAGLACYRWVERPLMRVFRRGKAKRVEAVRVL